MGIDETRRDCPTREIDDPGEAAAQGQHVVFVAKTLDASRPQRHRGRRLRGRAL